MNRMRQYLTALATFLSIAILCPAAQARSTCGGCVYVTTIVQDTDANGAATLLRSDDYNGTGQAVYKQGGGITSDIYGGIYFLDLYSQTLRTLYLTPNDAYAPAQNPPVPIPPPGYYSQYVEMPVHCYDASNNLVPLQNIVTSSGNCRLGVDFGYQGVKYKLDMGPVLAAPGPATGLVNVACNASSGGQCVNWTITPNPNGTLANVANLYYYARGGKLTFLGQYYNTFRIEVTNP